MSVTPGWGWSHSSSTLRVWNGKNWAGGNWAAQADDPQSRVAEHIAKLGIKLLTAEELKGLIEESASESLLLEIARDGNLDEEGYELLMEALNWDANAVAARTGLPESIRVKLYIRLTGGARITETRRALLQEKISEQGLLEIIEHCDADALIDLVENGGLCGVFQSPTACAKLMLENVGWPMGLWTKIVEKSPAATLNHLDKNALLNYLTEVGIEMLLERGEFTEALWPELVAKLKTGRDLQTAVVARHWNTAENITVEGEDYYWLAGIMEGAWKAEPLIEPQDLRTRPLAWITEHKDQIGNNIRDLGCIPGNKTNYIWEPLGENPNLGKKWLETEGLILVCQYGGAEKWANQLADHWARNPEELINCIKEIRNMRAPSDKTGSGIGTMLTVFEILSAAATLTKGGENKNLWRAIQKELDSEMLGELEGDGNIYSWATVSENYTHWPELTNIAVIRRARLGVNSGQAVEQAAAWLTRELSGLDAVTTQALKTLIQTKDVTCEDAVALAKEISAGKTKNENPNNQQTLSM